MTVARGGIYLKKYIIFLIAVVVIMLGAMGCARPLVNNQADNRTTAANQTGSSTKEGTGPDISSLVAAEAKAMSNITSCRANLHLEMNLKSSAVGNILITADMRSEIDTLNRLFSSIVTTNLSLSGNNDNLWQQVIASGADVYFKDGQQGSWQKKTLAEADLSALWKEQDQQLTGSSYSALLSDEDLVYSGKEVVNGYSCQALKQPVDYHKLLQIAPQLLDQMQSAADAGALDWGSVLQKVELVYLVDDQAGYLREVRISASVNQVKDGRQVTGQVRQYCRFDAFNEPLSIQIPEVR
jgi:hypothetical protein